MIKEFDSKRADKILKCLEVGMTREDSSYAAGIAPVIFNEWIDRGKERRGDEYEQFWLDSESAAQTMQYKLARRVTDIAIDLVMVERTESEDPDGNVTQRRVFKTDWKAAAFLLEKKFPETWGKLSPVGELPLAWREELEKEGIDPDELQRKLREVYEKMKAEAESKKKAKQK